MRCFDSLPCRYCTKTLLIKMNEVEIHIIKFNLTARYISSLYSNIFFNHEEKGNRQLDNMKIIHRY